MGGKQRHGRKKSCCGKMRHRTQACERCGATGLVRAPDARLVRITDSGLCTEGEEHICEAATVQPGVAPGIRGEAAANPAAPLAAAGLLDVITAEGSTMLPAPVREMLDVQAGDRVRYIIEGDAVRIVAVRPIHRLFGILQHEGSPVALDGECTATTAGGPA